MLKLTQYLFYLRRESGLVIFQANDSGSIVHGWSPLRPNSFGQPAGLIPAAENLTIKAFLSIGQLLILSLFVTNQKMVHISVRLYRVYTAQKNAGDSSILLYFRVGS